jgi:signal transduction histidine kinase
LSIAGLIVREHGGEIEVGDSELGGALVVITLPT